MLLGMDDISRQQMLQRKTILHRTPFPMDKGDRLHPIFSVGRVLNHIRHFSNEHYGLRYVRAVDTLKV
jgi:hypothetical protein